jgi:hypothetical protein
MEKLLTTGQAAERLGVHLITVFNYCRQGVFPNAQKVGAGRGFWVIPENDLIDFERPQVGYPKGRPRSQAGESEGGGGRVNEVARRENERLFGHSRLVW